MKSFTVASWTVWKTLRYWLHYMKPFHSMEHSTLDLVFRTLSHGSMFYYSVVWCILQCGCDATGSLSHEARVVFLSALVSDG